MSLRSLSIPIYSVSLVFKRNHSGHRPLQMQRPIKNTAHMLLLTPASIICKCSLVEATKAERFLPENAPIRNWHVGGGWIHGAPELAIGLFFSALS